jgi:hypothetical protein
MQIDGESLELQLSAGEKAQYSPELHGPSKKPQASPVGTAEPQASFVHRQ